MSGKIREESGENSPVASIKLMDVIIYLQRNEFVSTARQEKF